MAKIHKADYKRKFLKYIGFGCEVKCPTALCSGPKGIYKGNKYLLSRTWKNVTCKHCINKKGL